MVAPVALICLVMAACAPTNAVTAPSGAATTAPTPPPPPRVTTTTARPTSASPAPTSTPTDDLVLAFAGDSNAFKGGGASTQQGLGEAGRLLAAADLASVNLETALADDPTGLQKQPKLYTFLTDSAFPRMLAREGLDVVSMANNHAMDYGVEGLKRTLKIKRDLADELPMVGIGETVDEAFAPVEMQAKGRTVLWFGGTDVLEDNMDWYPADGQPGVAMVKSEERFQGLVSRVAEARRAQPDAVIVVWMHWGQDYMVCTQQDRQDRRARDLAKAGATLVVGTHAHRVQRMEMIGNTLVAYGLGNFNFFSNRVETRETGVLTIRLPRTGAPRADWAPGRIVDGRPVLLTGDEKVQAIRRWKGLPAGC